MLRPSAIYTLEALNLNLFDEIWTDEETGMPTVDACGVIPKRIVPFDKCKYKKNCECGVHFFVEDHIFNATWTRPRRYINLLSKFDCIISPDFSTYFDMPDPMIRWQIYRRRMLTQWYQRSGLNVIYNVQTLPERYDDDQMRGVEKGGVVAMKPPLRVAHNTIGRNEFYRILGVVAERLEPEVMLIYGNELPLPSCLKYKFYDNDHIRVRRASAERKRGLLAQGYPPEIDGRGTYGGAAGMGVGV